MATRETKIPSIGDVPDGLNEDLTSFLSAIKERLEIREGRANDLDRVLLRRDLSKIGIDVKSLIKEPPSYSLSNLIPDAVDNHYAKFTSTGLKKKTFAEVLADLSGTAEATFDFNSQNLAAVGTINGVTIGKRNMFVPFTHGVGSARFVSGYATGWDMDVVTDTCYASGALPSDFNEIVSVKLCWTGNGAGTYQPGVKIQVSAHNEAETTHTSSSVVSEGVYANDKTYVIAVTETAFDDATAGDSFGIQGFLNAYTSGGGVFTGVIIEYR